MKPEETVLGWLLEADNPPVRYLSLTHLLRRSPDDGEVREARARLTDYEVTQAILRRGTVVFQKVSQPYAKYRGLYWQLIFLGEFLADGSHPLIERAVLELLDKPDWVSTAGGQCLTANLLTAFRRLGYGLHPVVAEQTERLARRLLDDAGIRCAAMDYSLLPRCHMALPKLLVCFAEVPPRERSSDMERAIAWISTAVLEQEVFVYVPETRKRWLEVLSRQPKASELPRGETVKAWVAAAREVFLAENGLGMREPKSGWTRFGFPLHYNSDILEALHALAVAGAQPNPALEKALCVVEDKRTPDGRWLLENSLNGKMWADVEKKGEPSKWITYRALRVLDHFRGPHPRTGGAPMGRLVVDDR